MKLTKENTQDILPLTSLQEGLLFQYLKKTNSTEYVNQLELTVQGAVDFNCFNKAWQAVTDANEMLRAAFAWEKVKNPVQIVQKRWDVLCDYFDLSYYSPAKQALILKEVKENAIAAVNNLNSIPFATTLIKIAENSYVILVSNHHIIYDGWSNAILLEEFFSVYQSLQDNTPYQFKKKGRFKSFVALQGTHDEKSENYWAGYLSNYNCTRFTDKKASGTNTDGHENFNFKLPNELFLALQKFGQSHGCSLASIFNAAWGVLLQKYGNANDVVFGTTVSGRPEKLSNIENTVGLFINTVPVRVVNAEGQTCIDIIRKSFHDSMDRRDFENLALSRIIECTESKDSNLFDSIIVYENYPLNEDKCAADGLTIESVNIIESTHYQIAVVIRESNGIEILYTFKEGVLDKNEIGHFNKRFIKILETFVKNEQLSIDELDILIAQEKKTILNEFNNTDKEYPVYKNIVELFEEQVALSPQQQALCFKDVSISYDEFNRKVNKVARFLQSRKIACGDILAIAMERSIDMLIGIYGIIKAGGAYLPIDPHHPENRIQYIIENSGAKLLLVNSADSGALAEEPYAVCINNEQIAQFADTNLNVAIPADSPLYVIYTSGSTGNPKGVLIQHKALLNRLQWMQDRYPLTADDTLLQKTTYTFDVSVWELFWWSFYGAKLHILDPDAEKNPEKLAEAIERNNITVLHFVPSMLSSFLEYVKQLGLNSKLLPVRQVFVSGEELKSSHAKDFFKVFENASLSNLYGPTEASIDVSYFDLDKNNIPDIIPIGKPINNIRLYILDKRNQLQPVGVPGELVIAGVGLAKEYINNPELTAEKFPSSLRFSDERFYRTGDLAKWLPDGNIEFLGRIDFQVKIRGFRIEIGEIESRLSEHESIQNALVLVKGNANAENELVAYYESEADINAGGLKKYLLQHLPEYMIPAYFVKVSKFPVTSNGKIDRKSIGKIDHLQSVGSAITPDSGLVQEIAVAWEAVLGHKNFDSSSNFFEVGGNSLKIIRLSSMLRAKLKISLSVPVLFDHPTISSQIDYLNSNNKRLAKGTAKQHNSSDRNNTGSDIAVIGLSCRFPKAKNANEFWDNLRKGKDCITREKTAKEDGLIKAKGVLEDHDMFDASFFGYTPKEAYMLDPQTRVFHECTWEALEDAGYNPYAYEGEIGLYAGASPNPFYTGSSKNGSADNWNEKWEEFTYSDKDFLCSRIAYKLNLKGPCVNITTACSTSLVAVAQACSDLLSDKCDMAIAGGVSITHHDNAGYKYQEGMILSADGYCRAFDKKATGTIGGNGAGAVILKRLDDAIKDNDSIYAVIKAAATNNDGNQKVGYTAPSPSGQAEVIRKAIDGANINCKSISYIETHGTGTSLGDPVEFEGLKMAFDTDEKQFCRIGSVKTNIGHLDAAAGIASLLKVVLSLKNKMIPASLHYEEANAQIDFEESPFYVSQELRSWERNGLPRRAGVSSFGIGGTNAHLIVEEAPQLDEAIKNAENTDAKTEIILTSAKSEKSLAEYQVSLCNFLSVQQTNLADVAGTLQNCRAHHAFRHFIVADSNDEAAQKLSIQADEYAISRNSKAKTAFMFSGQGSQYNTMTLDLYDAVPFYRDTLNECFTILKTITKVDYRELLFSATDKTAINSTVHTQPLLFSVEYALAKYLIHIGIHPDVLIGHSIGEYVAACVADMISLQEALQIVVKRGELMQKAPKGAMISVFESIDTIQGIISADISVAAVNSPKNTVLSGSFDAIKAFESVLENEKIAFTPLLTSHAFHSEMMEGVKPEFEAFLENYTFRVNTIPIISNVSGKVLTDEQINDPSYWSRHLCGTVKFYDGIQEIIKEPALNMIEVGPGKSLMSFAKSAIKENDDIQVFGLIRHPKENSNDYRFFLNNIGKMWAVGQDILWERLNAGSFKKISLPAYAFEKNQFDKLSSELAEVDAAPEADVAQGIKKWFSQAVWNRSYWGHTDETPGKKRYLIFAGKSPLSEKLTGFIARQNNIILVEESGRFQKTDDGHYLIDCNDAGHYIELFDDLSLQNITLDAVINLSWVTHSTDQDISTKLLQNFHFINGLAKYKELVAGKVNIITNGIYDILGNESLHPDNSVLLGSVLANPYENPQLRVRLIEIGSEQARNVNDSDLSSIYSEIKCDSKEHIVAVRNSNRWVPSFSNLEKMCQTPASARIKKGGAYLITGGLGDIGFSLAEMLHDKYDCKLVLVGRSSLEGIKNSPDLDTQKKQRLDFIERNSSSIKYYIADIADYDEMLDVISQTKTLFGEIKGVIHSAGIVHDRSIKLEMNDMEVSDIQKQFQAKIKGTKVLADVVASIQPDFVVLMSSVASVVGGYGFGAYAASNAFMDSFCHFQNRTGNANWLSINWDGWSFAGEFDHILDKMGKHVEFIEKNDGIEAFETILSLGNISQVVVSLTDIAQKIEKYLQTEQKQQKNGQLHKRKALSVEYQAPQTDLQKNLASLWSQFFGYDKIGIYDDFFELGGDSLKLINLKEIMKTNLQLEISLNDLLSNSKINLLSEFFEGAGKTRDAVVEYPAVTHNQADQHKPFPLTPVQLAYLVGRKNGFELGNISTHGYIEIETGLENTKLNKALNKLIKRHPSLQLVITEAGEQKVLEDVPEYTIDYQDISMLSDADKKERLLAERQRMSHQVFDLEKWPLFELKTFQTSSNTLYLYFSSDLIIADAGSLELFAFELMHYYKNSNDDLPAPQITFRDYITGMESVRKSELYERDKKYWLSKIESFPIGTNLPLAKQPSEVAQPRFSRFERILDEGSWKKIKAIAKSNNITPSVLFCTAFAGVLAYWSNKSQIGLNLTYFNRLPFHKDVSGLIGDFTSLLLLSINYEFSESFYDNAKEIQKGLFEAIEYKHYDGVEFIGELRKAHGLYDKVIMPVVFTSTLKAEENDDSAYWDELGTIQHSISQTSQVILDHQLRAQQGKLYITWDFVEDLFDESVIAAMFESYTGFIARLIQGSNECKPKLPSNVIKGLENYNLTETVNHDLLLHGLFIDSAEKYPDAIALEDGEKVMTYSELLAKSNQLAHYLRNKNIGRGDFVGVDASRNMYSIISILGILISGAAYVPIEPEYPEERKKYILNKCNCKLLLDSKSFEHEDMSALPASSHELHNSPEDIAYVIFTSGSTGNPKGVVIKHSAAVNTIVDINQKFNVGAEDKVLGISSLCFDLSVYDLFGSLASGAGLVLLSDQRDVELMKTVLDEKKITIWNSVPAIMDMQTRYLTDSFKNSSLRLVLLSGDWIPLSLPDKIRKHFVNSEVISLGGATEASIWSIYFPVTTVGHSWKSIPYGYPLSGQQMYVLNYCGEPCPVDVPGEIFIGGLGVAEGYMNEAELTENAFIHHEEYGRIYKTGDIGVLRKDMYIDFLGRKDDQVKIRGFRIELGEIESQLVKLEGVKQAVAVLHKDAADENSICAYYVSDKQFDEDFIYKSIASSLPDYMLPSSILRIPEIPVTANGKVDKKKLQLPKASFNRHTNAVTKPSNQVEEQLLDVWKNVLGNDDIGTDDNFFNLGGTSIKIIDALKIINEKFPDALQVNELFANRTIRELAAVINKKMGLSKQEKPQKKSNRIEF